MKESIYPIWWPNRPPIYDIHKTYQQNFDEGPFYDGTVPSRIRPDESKWIDFLGFKVTSPLGVPAGPLLNGKWVEFAAKMGFDIVTYKTIRSRIHPAHVLPNMIYVNTQGDLSYLRSQERLQQATSPPTDMAKLAVTNSFGIPSQMREFLLADIAQTNASLAKGQVMIVSIVGTPREGEDFLEDFVACARIAQEGGAKIIEADLSCPNVLTCEGELYTSPEMVVEISKRLKKAIGSIPLVIKVGIFEDQATLRQIMMAAARSGVEAICGINTISMKVINQKGEPALGEKRIKAGVCGAPIRQVALDFIRMAKTINEEERLGLTLMGTGGVILPEHFDDFFETGADIAMSAVGMMWDPYLAARYHQNKENHEARN